MVWGSGDRVRCGGCCYFPHVEGCSRGSGVAFWDGLADIAGIPGAPGLDTVVTEVPFPFGSRLFSWLQTGNGAQEAWGFRFEVTVTPQGMTALGLEPGSVPSPDLLGRMESESWALLEEVGFVSGPDGLFDFSGRPHPLD